LLYAWFLIRLLLLGVFAAGCPLTALLPLELLFPLVYAAGYLVFDPGDVLRGEFNVHLFTVVLRGDACRGDPVT
jgi:hypothetical protein